MSPVTSYSAYREQPIGNSGSGLDQTLGWIARDPGLAGANESGSISTGIAAADGLNRLIAEGLRAINALNKPLLLAADIVALNAWFRDPTQPERLTRFLALHGDDENGTETGFHTIQNDGGNRRFDGRALIDTVLDSLYHIGFPLSADGTRLTNEDGNDNATLTDVARWLTLLKQDLATSGSDLDRIVETIVADPGLQASISPVQIAGGAQAANDLNQLILAGITALDERGRADRDNTRLSAAEVTWINGWIQSDPARYAFFVERHGDDENGVETGYHLVQNDGATTQLFGQNAVNTIYDGIFHIGFTINADGRFQNEDGDANARVSDVAEWITYYYGDPSTTGSGLDRLVDWIRLDPGLAKHTSALDINDGLAAANSLNGIFLEAVAATDVNLDGWISRNDLRTINRWVRTNRYTAFVLHHGDDENGEETGFHKIQNDGATTPFFGQNLVNTVADGIYHYGFEIRGENYLNEDGDTNQSLSDVSGWVNYFLSNRRLTLGSDNGETISGTGEAEQVLARGGDDVVDGFGGSDLLDGGWGNDILRGGAGADVLDGGFGDDSLDGGEDGDTYLASGANPDNPNWQTYSFQGYDSYADSGSSGVDVILAQGAGAVDIGLRNFGPSSGIEQIINATEGGARVTLLGNWQANVFDVSTVALIGGNFLINPGDGNDTVIGTAGADLIQGGRGEDNLNGGGGGDTYLVSGYDPNWYADRPYTFNGYDGYADSGAAGDGVDQIVATGSGPVDIGFGGNFSASNGIEQIVNGTATNSQVRLMGSWEANRLDFSSVALVGGNFLVDGGDGNDTVIGTAGADLIQGGRGEDSLNGGGGGDTYLVSGYDPNWSSNRPYTFNGYDSYADSGAAGDGVDQIVATGSGPVDIGFGGNFSAASGIERIVNATGPEVAQVRLLANWQANSFDLSNVALVGGNFLIDAGDGNDTVIGSAGADLIRGGRDDDSLNGGGGGDTYLVSGTNTPWSNDRPYTFNGYDSYADGGAAGDGVDQIVANGSGPVDMGFSRNFSAASGIERIVNATEGNALVTLLGNWQANSLDFSNVALVGGNFLIDAGDGNDTVIGTAGADLIRGGRDDDSLNGGGGGDTYLVSGTNTPWSNDRPYTFNGYDSYADGGAAGDGVDQIVATGSGPVDIGFGGNFSAASGIEQIVNGTEGGARVTLLGNWQANSFDLANVALVGGNFLIDAGDGNDSVIGTTAADLIRGGRNEDTLDGAGGGDTYLVSGYDPNWYSNRPYTFEGYDTYADSGAAADGIDQILATGTGPVDIGLARDFSAASGIEQIVNATTAAARVTLLGSWEANSFDLANVALVGGNFLIDAGDGNDSVIGTANADLIRGGRNEDTLDGAGGGDTYLVSGYDPNWYSNRPYTFEGYDTYADSGAAADGIDQILATGTGPVDIGLARDFSAASGIEQIVNATTAAARVTLLGSWEANSFDLANVALVGGNFLIDAGDGNDSVIGTTAADLIRGGRNEDTLDGAGGGDTYLVSGYDPNWYSNRPYTFEGYDTYSDSGDASDGLDQILASGTGPVDIGLARDFSAASGIEQIVNATTAAARVTLLGSWEANSFDLANVALVGGNFLIDAGDGNDTVIGTANADLIRGGRNEDTLDGAGGGDTYLVSGYDPNWYSNRPYTFEGYDTYADSGAAADGIDQILATGTGPVDIGLARDFSAASGIEQIVNATTAAARVTLLGSWEANSFDLANVALVGGNFLIDAGDGNDSVIGTAGDDLIQGGRGDDNLDGGGGGDTYLVSGYDPNWYADRPYTFNGYDTYTDSGDASDGLDQILASGSGAVDIGLGCEFSAFSGIERIVNATSNTSQVRLLGSWEANSWDFSTVTLSGGNVLIDAGDGQDMVRGSAAADRIRGGRDNDWLDGGAGNDTYLVSGSDPNWYADRPYTFEGYDTYADSSGYDRIVAVAANGRDNVDIAMPSFGLASGIELIDATGTTGSVRLLGTSSSNSFDFSATELRGSNVRIDLGDSNDSFIGSSAGDTVSGGYGDDRISSRAGDDTISGGGGNDSLDGGEGSDTYLVSGLESGGWQSYGGTDSYGDTGRTGVDRIMAIGADNVDIGLAGGNFLTNTGIEQIVNSTSKLESGVARTAQVRLQGNWAANTLNFSRVRLLGGNVLIDAGDGNDTVTGSADAETILAGLGADTVNAGAGDDTISGGGGLDSLTGGSGADSFVYTTLSDGVVGGSASARTFEKIIGFTVGLDRFDVTTVPPAGGFRNLGAVAGLNDTALGSLLSATTFVANGAATFSFGSGTSLRSFIAFNDATAGFNASSDAVLEISGFGYASGFNSLAQINLV